jgi:hypothetical protein
MVEVYFYLAILKVNIRILYIYMRSSKLNVVNIKYKRHVNSLFMGCVCGCWLIP